MKRGVAAPVLSLLLLYAAAAAAETRLLVIVGLPGNATFDERFRGWAEALLDAAARAGLTPAQLRYLAPEPPPSAARPDEPPSAGAAVDDGTRGDAVRADAGAADDPPRRADGASDRAGIDAALAQLAAAAGPDDDTFIVLIGHGSARDGAALFNIPGPDLSAEDFDARLAPLAGRVAVINTAAASGPFVAALSAPNRVVVTATADAAERYAPRFGGYFVDAYANGVDLDKDGRTSLLEAFNYARLEVERFYRDDRRLKTEHALLDDGGDGVGSRAPDGAPDGDGALARRLFLQPPVTAADPALSGLLDQRRRLEDALDALRRDAAARAAADYDERLEALLIELALIRRELRARGAE